MTLSASNQQETAAWLDYSLAEVPTNQSIGRERNQRIEEAERLAITIKYVQKNEEKFSVTPNFHIQAYSGSPNKYSDSYHNMTNSGIVSLVDWIERAYTSELNDARCDLREAKDEASEEGFPRPSDIALENAERLLSEMYRIYPRRFEVYPTPDGEIAIDAPDGQGQSVILLCDSEGGALCLVNMNGKHRRARYSTTETLPDGFVREALEDLKRSSNQFL